MFGGRSDVQTLLGRSTRKLDHRLRPEEIVADNAIGKLGVAGLGIGNWLWTKHGVSFPLEGVSRPDAGKGKLTLPSPTDRMAGFAAVGNHYAVDRESIPL